METSLKNSFPLKKHTYSKNLWMPTAKSPIPPSPPTISIPHTPPPISTPPPPFTSCTCSVECTVKLAIWSIFLGQFLMRVTCQILLYFSANKILYFFRLLSVFVTTYFIIITKRLRFY